MGSDSLEPFFDYKDKLNFVLALTSNRGAVDFEKLELSDGSFLYQKVIKTVINWNKNKNCGLVFGATNSEELDKNINLFGELPVLLPGIGAQGGSLEDVVGIFKKNSNKSFLINVSRSLIYKDSSLNFGAAAKDEIVSLNNTISGIWNS
jgi:orotidine-5'-phosphate decarboxylase